MEAVDRLGKRTEQRDSDFHINQIQSLDEMRKRNDELKNKPGERKLLVSHSKYDTLCA